jgi:hypothetical protein
VPSSSVPAARSSTCTTCWTSTVSANAAGFTPFDAHLNSLGAVRVADCLGPMVVAALSAADDRGDAAARRAIALTTRAAGT